jgi:hypothetical protein
MPSAESENQHASLSDKLQQIGRQHRRELPMETASLTMRVGKDKKIEISAYNTKGQYLGVIPNGKTSTELCLRLEYSFSAEFFSNTVSANL